MASRSRRLPPGIAPPEWSAEKETLDHFERFCWNLWLEDETRFRLREFQLAKLEDYFAHRRREIETAGADGAIVRVELEPVYFTHLWEEPTGQGKSGLLGALSLHHGSFVVPRPRVFVLGGEAGHAQNTTNAAAAFVIEAQTRGEVLGAWWDPQAHAGGRLMPMWLDGDDVGIFARTAGRKTAKKGGSSVEGKNPTLILVEELHRHEDGGAAMDTLVTKTAKAAVFGRSVKTVVVTTAGVDQKNSRLGQMETRATNPDEGATITLNERLGEYYRRGVDAAGELVAHIWAVPEHVTPKMVGLDAWFEHVKKANPADWITVRTLRRIWNSLDRHGRWMFLRQNANQWVTAGLAALDRGQFWSLRKKGLTIPEGPGVKVYVGLDRASKWDSTAIVPVWKPEGGKVRCSGAVILHSPRDGKRRRTRDVAGILNAMRERWPDMVIVFDRNHGGGDVAEEFEEEHGLTVIDHGQGTEFDLASMRLAEYVEEGKFRWDALPEHLDSFATQVLAAVMKDTAGGRRWRGEAPDDDTPADAFDALAMALHQATLDAAADDGGDDDIDLNDYRIRTL